MKCLFRNFRLNRKECIIFGKERTHSYYMKEVDVLLLITYNEKLRHKIEQVGGFVIEYLHSIPSNGL